MAALKGQGFGKGLARLRMGMIVQPAEPGELLVQQGEVLRERPQCGYVARHGVNEAGEVEKSRS